MLVATNEMKHFLRYKQTFEGGYFYLVGDAENLLCIFLSLTISVRLIWMESPVLDRRQTPVIIRRYGK